MNYGNLPIPKQSVTAIVSSQREVEKRIKQAFELLIEAKKIMQDTLGEDHYPSLWDRSLDHYDIDKSSGRCQKHILRQFWRYIIRLTNIEDMMSSKRKEEVFKQLEKGELPELTEANIYGWIDNLSKNVNGILDEAVQSVFDFLRPPRSEFKTNTEFELGEKCIITWVFDYSFGFIHLNHSKENDLRDLDNVFHLMDGKGVAKYPGNLMTAIRSAMSDKKMEAETPYFACKWYKKGTLHIRFKRMDLVNKLNRIAGGNRLKS